MGTRIEQTQRSRQGRKSLAELMTLYEDNFVRFNQLVRQLHEAEGEYRSIKLGDVTLHLQIIQRSRYTTTLLLTYLLDLGENKPTRTPDLKIRIYHDAHQAEVMSCCLNDPSAFSWLERSACRSTMEWRWCMNRFLFKWLNHCLKSGHGFPQKQSGINWSNLLESA